MFLSNTYPNGIFIILTKDYEDVTIKYASIMREQPPLSGNNDQRGYIHTPKPLILFRMNTHKNKLV